MYDPYWHKQICKPHYYATNCNASHIRICVDIKIGGMILETNYETRELKLKIVYKLWVTKVMIAIIK